jgi:hypothetical protein
MKKNLPRGKIGTGGFIQDGGQTGGLALQGLMKKSLPRGKIGGFLQGGGQKGGLWLYRAGKEKTYQRGEAGTG